MINRKSYYYLIVLFFLLACGKQKKQQTVVSGKIVNYGSRAPIDSVLVVLQDGVAASGSIIDGKTSTDTKNITYTNTNGEFRVEIKGEHIPYLWWSKEGYIRYDKQVGMEIKPYTAGKVHENQVLEMQADAFFDGFFKSFTPSLDDTLIVDPLSYLTLQSTYFSRTFYGIGPHKWVYSPYRGIGDMYLKFKLDFTRNKQWHSKIDSVYIKSFETFKDTIYY